MSFIVRQYLVDRLKEHHLDCAFKDDSDMLFIFIRNNDFEIEYHVHTDTYFIHNVVFTDTHYYQELFYYEKIIEKILDECERLRNYLKLERNIK